jgi:hypothetical protein
LRQHPQGEAASRVGPLDVEAYQQRLLQRRALHQSLDIRQQPERLLAGAVARAERSPVDEWIGAAEQRLHQHRAVAWFRGAEAGPELQCAGGLPCRCQQPRLAQASVTLDNHDAACPSPHALQETGEHIQMLVPPADRG